MMHPRPIVQGDVLIGRRDMSEHEQAWPKEPWQEAQRHEYKTEPLLIVSATGKLVVSIPLGTARSKEIRARIVACVNACVGMDDLAKEITELRAKSELVLELAEALKEFFRIERQFRQEGFRISEEVTAALHKAEAALAKVGVKP